MTLKRSEVRILSGQPMWKVIVWPLILLVFREYQRYSFRAYEGDLGFGILGAAFIELFIIASLFLYIPLIILYIHVRKSQQADINLLISLGIGMISLIVGVLLLFSFRPMQQLVDTIFLSRWWNVRFLPPRSY